jgi:NAD-dependent dihydropyrimidine dehydrogenase PreA subunit
LFNFTPAHVHQLNNKSTLLHQLKDIKRKTREKRKAYWEKKQNITQPSIEEGCPGKGQCEIVDPGANTEAVFLHRQPDSHSESPTTKNDSLDSSILSH